MGAAQTLLPSYDPNQYCDKVAQSGGDPKIRAVCLQNEEGAYDRLRKIWDSLSPSIQMDCDRLARKAGASFTILETCVRYEVQQWSGVP